jgi:hypothetical protein
MSNPPEPNNRAPVGGWDARSDKDDRVLTFALPFFDLQSYTGGPELLRWLVSSNTE